MANVSEGKRGIRLIGRIKTRHWSGILITWSRGARPQTWLGIGPSAALQSHARVSSSWGTPPPPPETPYPQTPPPSPQTAPNPKTLPPWLWNPQPQDPTLDPNTPRPPPPDPMIGARSAFTLTKWTCSPPAISFLCLDLHWGVGLGFSSEGPGLTRALGQGLGRSAS